MKKIFFLFAISFLLSSFQKSYAHCEIPCGIYDDQLRIELIKEHITTIEKSMNQIMELSKDPDANFNQLIRWVTNKEEHANKIQNIVSQYFLTQRIKPVDKSDQEKYDVYIKQLTLLHEIIIYSMKAKQTLDIQHITKMRELVEDFEAVYFGPHDHHH